MTYPDTLGYNTETSKEAAQLGLDKALNMRETVLKLIKQSPFDLSTQDIAKTLYPQLEIERAVRKVQMRVSDLKQLGFIKATGTVKNRNNRTTETYSSVPIELVKKLYSKQEIEKALMRVEYLKGYRHGLQEQDCNMKLADANQEILIISQQYGIK